MKKIKIHIIFFFIVAIPIAVSSQTAGETNGADNKKLPPVELNKRFILEVAKTRTIDRNSAWEKYFDRIVVAKGYVQGVKKVNRYRRNYRIILFDNYNYSRLSVIFHLYTDSSEYVKLLNKGDVFEFKGQFVMYTAMNTKKDTYIIDIVLEDGALVVE